MDSPTKRPTATASVNLEFISVDRPSPTFVLGPGQVLHPGVLDPETCGKQTLKTALDGRI
jgi:hypothetical protein